MTMPVEFESKIADRIEVPPRCIQLIPRNLFILPKGSILDRPTFGLLLCVADHTPVVVCQLSFQMLFSSLSPGARELLESEWQRMKADFKDLGGVVSDEIEGLKMRIAQLEQDFKNRSMILPQEPDRSLAKDEWWAVFSDYQDPITGYISKIQPKMLSGSSALFKVKKVL